MHSKWPSSLHWLERWWSSKINLVIRTNCNHSRWYSSLRRLQSIKFWFVSRCSRLHTNNLQRPSKMMAQWLPIKEKKILWNLIVFTHFYIIMHLIRFNHIEPAEPIEFKYKKRQCLRNMYMYVLCQIIRKNNLTWHIHFIFHLHWSFLYSDLIGSAD